MMRKRDKIVIVGAGFAGLAAACHLAHAGCSVSVLERHGSAGGRARQWNFGGFTFDMGPSWYWMPDVFERFFETFGHKVSDYYQLKQLDPAFSIVFGKDKVIGIPAHMQGIELLFESLEEGSAARLRTFLHEAKYKYGVGMHDLVYKPGLSLTEFLDLRIFKSILRLGMLESYATHVRSFFHDERLIRIMEFPVLFLGAIPEKIPAMYSLMAYAGLSLGTWYPMGGMYEIIRAMENCARSLGVEFSFDCDVQKIHVRNGRAISVDQFPADAVIGAADYHHTEQLLDKEYRSYDAAYWESRSLSPSAIIFYLGLNRKIEGLGHHTLFFDAPFDVHAEALYSDTPSMPAEPLFYVCAPSVTDPAVAPPGCENLFVLIPVSTEMEDSHVLRQECFEKVMTRLEMHTGTEIRNHIIVQRSYAKQDFLADYHALRGNAYGLANTLRQTAILKPRIRSRKVSNLFFAGQLTVPGPGVPPALISGELAARQVLKELSKGSSLNTSKNAAAII